MSQVISIQNLDKASFLNEMLPYGIFNSFNATAHLFSRRAPVNPWLVKKNDKRPSRHLHPMFKNTFNNTLNYKYVHLLIYYMHFVEYLIDLMRYGSLVFHRDRVNQWSAKKKYRRPSRHLHLIFKKKFNMLKS